MRIAIWADGSDDYVREFRVEDPKASMRILNSLNKYFIGVSNLATGEFVEEYDDEQ